jgi:tetratricopeptide (TPR) repeat protein
VAAALRLIEDGRQQMQQGAYDAALDRFERAVAIDPTSAYGYYFLARVHFLRKSYDQAIAFASRAASLTARTDRIWLGRIRSLEAAVFEEVGRYPDARKAYQQALEADPDNLSAQVGIARLSPGE